MYPRWPSPGAWHPYTPPGIIQMPARLPLDDCIGATAAERACCCSAKPQVNVIMPASSGRRFRIELLMCAHHYRTHRQALESAGASAYDLKGWLLDTEDEDYASAV